MMKKFLSIIGPTATGKTNLALTLAESLLVEKNFQRIDLISADSRQIYQGIGLLTGADVPKNFTKKHYSSLPYPHWQHPTQNINLHGVSIITPENEWSVAHFKQFATEVIKFSWQNQGLPIVVGGTGLYQQQLLGKGNQQAGQFIDIKPNAKIRAKTAKMSVTDLQNWLNKLSPTTWRKLNHSDRHNPRRLIRKIEIAEHLSRQSQAKETQNKSGNLLPAAGKQSLTLLNYNQHFTIGLREKLTAIKAKTKQRVAKRWQAGVKQEVATVLKKYPQITKQASSATGFQEIQKYLAGQLSQEECLKKWTLREYQYAKRQITWWKAEKNISWLDASDAQLKKKAYAIVKKLIAD